MRYLLKITFLLFVWANSAKTAEPLTLRIFPNSVYLKWGESAEFYISGQRGPVRWSSSKGEISAATEEGTIETPEITTDQLQIVQGDKIKYTAPDQAGTYTIAATDRSGIAIAKIQVLDISLNILTGGNKTLVVDDQRALSLQVWLSNSIQQDYTEMATWKSSEPNVLTVDKGLITALKPGVATISASLREKTAEVEMEVQAKMPIGLVVTPSRVYLAINRDNQKLNTKQQVKIEEVLKNGGNRLPATNCQLTANPMGLIDIVDMELTAKNPGYATVHAVCGELKTNIPVFISPSLPLEINPESLMLDREESRNFQILGGVPPYTVRADRGKIKSSGEQWQYEADRSAGEGTIRVEDQEGTTIELPVTVMTGLMLSPLAVNLAVKANQTFTISGGVPPYRWQSTVGTLSANEGEQVTYTAPGIQGSYELTVIDSKGHIKTAIIHVNNGLLMASPSELIMLPDEERHFFVTGGTPPYKVSTSASSYSGKDGIYYYTAPAVSGSHNITVTDAEARKATIAVIVQPSLQVTPSELFLSRNEEAELQITGGYGEYFIFTETGEWRENKIYQAADVAGQDVITIRDQAGTVVKVNVSVSQEGFYVSPVRSYLLPGEESKLRAFGGIAPYRWRVHGEGSLSSTEGEQVTFTAPTVVGVYSVVVMDSTGKEIKHIATVYQNELQLTPEILALAPGKTANLQALLGVPTYRWRTKNGTLSASEGQEVTYTAPKRDNTKDKIEDTIWLRDASGKVKTSRVIIDMGTVNLCRLYVGSDDQLNETELSNAIGDFFQKEGWINRQELFFLLEECWK
jgi:hypothetical protein